MRAHLGEFRSFYNNSEDSHSLFASLIIVPDLAFGDYNFRLYRSRLTYDDEPRRTEVEYAPELIASLDSLDGLI